MSIHGRKASTRSWVTDILPSGMFSARLLQIERVSGDGSVFRGDVDASGVGVTQAASGIDAMNQLSAQVVIGAVIVWLLQLAKKSSLVPWISDGDRNAESRDRRS